jgi:hypothetical protein
MPYTLTYSPPAEGWPSFYSFEPEWIQGMNQYLYTFNGGNLFRHNTNEVRNNFYGQQFNSTIQSVFNDDPIVNKVFKTLQIEGNRPWAATFTSDQQDGRFMDVGFFEKKEGDWFAFVRTENNNPALPDEYALRSLSGIGISDVVAAGQVVSIGSILSIGDDLYYALPPLYDSIVYAGVVTAVNVDIPNGINQILHNNGGTPTLVQDALWLGIKNQQAESNGLLGHYGVFELTNTDTEAVEMFVARTEAMKSYPG